MESSTYQPSHNHVAEGRSPFNTGDSGGGGACGGGDGIAGSERLRRPLLRALPTGAARLLALRLVPQLIRCHETQVERARGDDE